MKTLMTLWLVSVCAAAQAAPTQAAQSRAESAGADDDDPKSRPQPPAPNGPRPAPAPQPTQPPGTERDLTGDDSELPPLRVQAPPAGMVEVKPAPADDNELTRTAPPRAQQRFRPWVTAVVIGSVACAAGLAIGLGVGLSNKSDHTTAPSGSLGTIHY
jgi:hypothetical protein